MKASVNNSDHSFALKQTSLRGAQDSLGSGLEVSRICLESQESPFQASGGYCSGTKERVEHQIVRRGNYGVLVEFNWLLSGMNPIVDS